MEPIRMVDLVNQHNNLRKELNVAINKVIDEASFILGPEVGSFEKKLGDYLGDCHVVSCANGTDALKIALMALELPPGSEVIMPAFTFVSPAEVAVLLGLKPVFADVNPHTFNIETASIESLITAKTAAIIPVHLFGQCADMENIRKIATRNKLHVIEDTAQALGSEYQFSDGEVRKAGTMGHIGCTSFFPAKNLGCMGDGGALFTHDEKLADKARTYRNHGQQANQYHYQTIGLNSRLDSLQAAVLNVKLPWLNRYNNKRKQTADYYDTCFQNNSYLQIPYRDHQSSHIFHQYTMLVHKNLRNELQKHLQVHNIPSKVYYPEPLHKHPAYHEICGDITLEESENLSRNVLSLPIHTELNEEQLHYISTTVNHFFENQ